MAAWEPLLYFSISTFLGLVALQTPQLYRSILVLPLSASGIVAFRKIADLTPNPELSSAIGLFVLIWLLHITCVLCVDQHVIPEDPSISTWKMAYKMLFNPRRLEPSRREPKSRDLSKEDGAHSTKRSPSGFSKDKTKTTPQNQSRAVFLLTCLFSCILYYIIYRLYKPTFTSTFLSLLSGPPSLDLIEIQSLFRRLPNITLPETLLKTLLIPDFILTTYLLDNFFHSLFALFFVGIGLDAPSDWPPLYGSITETYTLRNFWGKFWHRLVYRTYASYSALLSHKILHIRPKSSVDRFLTNFLIFCFSGCAHAVVTWHLGFKCGYWEDIAWFVVTYVGMAGEGFVKGIVDSIAGRKKGGLRALIERLAGYAWVYGFLFWSLPKWVFPKAVCGVA
jgi:hypothetical protein